MCRFVWCAHFQLKVSYFSNNWSCCQLHTVFFNAKIIYLRQSIMIMEQEGNKQGIHGIFVIGFDPFSIPLRKWNEFKKNDDYF